MRRVGIAVAIMLASSLAHAQAPGDQPPPTPSPPADQPPQPTSDQPPPVPQPPPNNDAALVDLYGHLFSPWTPSDQRRTAVEDAILGDSRAVGPLAYLLGQDRDPTVRAGAARALGRMQPDHRIDLALVATARFKGETPAVRIAAIQSLGVVGSDDTATTLRDLYTSTDEPQDIRDAAKQALATRWPKLLEQAGPVVDRRGRDGLIVGSVALGSYTLGAVGGLGRNNAGIAIGIIGGAVTGGITAAYLTRSGEITRAQAGWIVTGGMWGAGLGMATAATIQSDPDHRLVLSLGLLGEGAAVAAAASTRKGLQYTAGDVAAINATGVLAVDLAASGLLLANPTGDQRPIFGTLAGAAVVGLGAGMAITQHLTFSQQDKELIALGAYEGEWFGALTPKALDSTGDNHETSAALGAPALGIIGAAALSQSVELTDKQLGMMLLFDSYGKLAGYSASLLANGTNGVDDARGVLVGSVAGLAAGGLAADDLHFHGGRAALVTLGTGVGAWHGLALGLAADTTDRRVGGLLCAGTAVGGIGTIALAQSLEISNSDVQALTGGLFWGTWFSAWGSALENVSTKNALHLTLAAGDAGMAVGGLLVSPAVGVDPRRIGIAYLGGLSGAALASLGAALVTRNNDTLVKANLIGSGGGLLIGALIAQSWTFAARAPASSTPASGAPISLRAPLMTPIVLPPPPGSGAMPGIGIGALFVE